MKRVLVTGASGFVGRNSLLPLLERGFEVHAVRLHPDDASRNVRWHKADLLDLSAASRLLKEVRPSHLLHFAWNVKGSDYWTSAENLDWVQAGLCLLRVFAENGGERAVLAGTCAEYDWKHGHCFEEDTPARPSTLYGTCKNSLREILAHFSTQAGFSSAWGRIFFLYGPHEAESRLVPYVINHLLLKRPVQCSHGRQVRDFMHVQDAGEAFAALLACDVEGSVNIASGRSIAVKELVLTLARRFGLEELVELGARPLAESEPMLLAADVRRLNREVGWTPGIPLEEGLQRTIEWWEGKSCKDEK